MASDELTAARDEYAAQRTAAAKWDALMWGADLFSKARTEYAAKARAARAAAAAAKRTVVKLEAEERRAEAEAKRAAKAAERAAAKDGAREDREDRIGLRQDGRSGRVATRQGAQTDRTSIRQGGKTDRTALRQTPENVAARSGASSSWATATGESVPAIAAAVAALYSGEAGDGGGLLGGLASEHGEATGKAAADELIQKALPWAIGAVILIGGALYLGRT